MQFLQQANWACPVFEEKNKAERTKITKTVSPEGGHTYPTYLITWLSYLFFKWSKYDNHGYKQDSAK